MPFSFLSLRVFLLASVPFHSMSVSLSLLCQQITMSMSPSACSCVWIMSRWYLLNRSAFCDKHGIVMHYCEVKCHAQRLTGYLQGLIKIGPFPLNIFLTADLSVGKLSSYKRTCLYKTKSSVKWLDAVFKVNIIAKGLIFQWMLTFVISSEPLHHWTKLSHGQRLI